MSAPQTTNITKCDTCRKDVKNNDDAIECERCLRWLHFECSGLTKGEFDVMKRKNCKLTWLCADCKPKLLRMMEIEDKVTEKLATQMQTIMANMMDGIQEAIKQGFKATAEVKAEQHQTTQHTKKSRAPNPPEIEASAPHCDSTPTTTNKEDKTRTSIAEQEEIQRDPSPAELPWTEVAKRRNREIVGGKDTKNGMRAATKKAWLFVGRLHEETTEEDLSSYLTDNGITGEITCERIEIKGRNKAYKVGMDFENLEKTNEPSFWPKNVLIRTYRFPRPTPGILPARGNTRDTV